MAVGSRPLVPSRLAPGGLAQRAHGVRRQPRTVLGAYVALTKPRIIELLLITTVPTMVLAERGWPSLGLVLITLVGGTLAAGGANAINMYVDRDIDALMPRTQDRPLVTGRHRAAQRAGVRRRPSRSPRSPCCGPAPTCSPPCSPSSATLFYVFVYTLWLKRTSRQNIVIGGAAGAVPVLVGWAAVHRTRSAGRRWCCSLAMFLWTPPHFWALAIRYADDYRAANVPMLPAVAPLREAGPPDGRLHGGAGRRRRWCWCPSPTSAGSTPSPPWCSARCSSPAPWPWLGDPTPAAQRCACSRYSITLRHAAVRRADARRPRPS